MSSITFTDVQPKEWRQKNKKMVCHKVFAVRARQSLFLIFLKQNKKKYVRLSEIIVKNNTDCTKSSGNY